MASRGHMAFSVLALILCRLVAAKAAEHNQVLAVTVSGLDCTMHGSQGSHTTTCALHACTTTSADSRCQQHRMSQLVFASCDQGAVLISTRDILQHLQAAADAAEDARADAYDADSLLQEDSNSSSTASSVSLLHLAAACTPAEATGTPVWWSDTFTLDLSQEDSSQVGLADQHSVADSWSDGAADLEKQLVLVDLLLPAAPELPTSGDAAASTAEGSQVQEEDAMPDAEPEAQQQQSSTCSARWHVWLARAGMVVWVVGLQLLPMSSFVQRASQSR
jgi:hypothetical protein